MYTPFTKYDYNNNIIKHIIMFLHVYYIFNSKKIYWMMGKGNTKGIHVYHNYSIPRIRVEYMMM